RSVSCDTICHDSFRYGSGRRAGGAVRRNPFHQFRETSMQLRIRLLAGAVMACVLGLPAHAQVDDADLPKRLQAEEAELVSIRAAFPPLFAEAYARYPQIPKGVLEAIAYSQSR